MRIALAADHAGFELKSWLLKALENAGHTLLDKGTYSTAPVDYPDCAQAVGEALRQGEVDRAILICGSGVGASIAVNKMPGVRGGLCHDTYSAHQGVEHDDMNVLVLGARVIGVALAEDLVRAFLSARFTGEERHVRRLSKVQALEARFSSGAAAASGSTDNTAP